MLTEYIYIFTFFLISSILSFVIVFAAMFLVLRNNDIEKVSAYECGFHPFEDTRVKFDVRFYLVAILFIIFDLEITFLFPWSLNILYIDYQGFLFMLFFIYILFIGFFYEWKKGALDWE